MPNTTNFNWTTPADTDLVKDGALAIRTLANGIDTSLVDLKGGTTGQVLSKATNTDLDFTWVAQDDSNAIQNAIIDAKGDLIVGTAADTPARLAVGGTNGHVLTVDSGEASGIKWAAVSAGSNWSLLNSGGTTLSGTNVSITGISGKDKIMVLIKNASITTSGIAFGIRINSDTGNNYHQYGDQGGEIASSTSKIFIAYVPSGTASGGITLTGCNSSGVKAFQSVGGSSLNGGYTLQGYYDSSSTISSIQVYADGFTFGGGTVYVYTSA